MPPVATQAQTFQKGDRVRFTDFALLNIGLAMTEMEYTGSITEIEVKPGGIYYEVLFDDGDLAVVHSQHFQAA